MHRSYIFGCKLTQKKGTGNKRPVPFLSTSPVQTVLCSYHALQLLVVSQTMGLGPLTLSTSGGVELLRRAVRLFLTTVVGLLDYVSGYLSTTYTERYRRC